MTCLEQEISHNSTDPIEDDKHSIEQNNVAVLSRNSNFTASIHEIRKKRVEIGQPLASMKFSQLMVTKFERKQSNERLFNQCTHLVAIRSQVEIFTKSNEMLAPRNRTVRLEEGHR